MSHSKDNIVLVEKWTCEKCRIYAFEDYEEACAHELSCAGQGHPTQNLLGRGNKASKDTMKIESICKNALGEHTSTDAKKPSSRTQSSMEAYKSTRNIQRKVKNQGTLNQTVMQKILRKTKPLHEDTITCSHTNGNQNLPLASIFLKNNMRLQSSDIPSNNNKKEKKLDPSLTENCAVKGESGDAIQNIKCSEHKEGPRKPLTSKRQKVMDFESSSTTTLVDLTAESQEKSSGRTKDSRPLKADIDVSDDDILSTIELIHILYPNPSHILTEDISSCTGKQLFLMDQSYHRPIISSTIMESITDDTPINLDLNSSCNRAPQSSSIMYEVLSSIFDRSHSITSDIDMVNWSEKYRIQNIPKDVCGSSNIEAAEKMIEFIENWRIHRQSAIDTRNEKVKEMLGIKRKKESSKKRQVYASDDDDDYLSDDDVGGLPSVLLLTGPTGSGKTSLVHAVATKCQCVVLEVNSTMKRSGQAVKNIIEESTQSHSNLALLKVGISQEVDEICIEENIASKDNGVASLSLVLIDEVDLVFENDGDAGFWQNLSTLTKRAKSPIILTASCIPQPLLNSKSVKFVHLVTERPTPIECASKISQIAKQEGLAWWKPSHQNLCVTSRLVDFAKLCHCDIRKMLNEMQFFAASMKNTCELKKYTQAEIHTDLDELDISRSVPGACFSVAYPIIITISPLQVLSLETETTLTIKGKNFQSLIRRDYFFQVGIGDHLSSNVHILDNETVTAKVPMIVEMHSTTDDLKSERYMPVIFRVVNGKGEVIVASDASICRVNDDGFYSSSPNIEYIFPESTYFMEARSKANFELRQKRLKDKHHGQDWMVNETNHSSTKVNSSVFNPSQSFSDYSVIADNAPSDNSERSDIKYSQSFNIPDDCTKIDYINFRTQDATRSVSYEKEDPVAIVTPSSQDSIKIGREFRVDNYLQSAFMDSDISYLADACNWAGYPILSGAVEALNVNESTDKLCGKSSLLCDDLRGSVFSGANETFLTRPTTGRDRGLLKTAFKRSRGFANLPSQILSIPAFHPKDTESDSPANRQLSLVQTADEDMFLPGPMAQSLSLMPDVLKEISCRLLGQSTDRKRFQYDILDFDRGQRMERLLGMHQTIVESHLPFDLKSIWFQSQLFLDYIPCLRNMAYFERRKDRNQNQVCVRNRTRRSAARIHYFDVQLNCQSGALIANELNELRLGHTAETNANVF